MAAHSTMGWYTGIGGMEQRVGLRTLDPVMNQSTTILNNYFEHYFNTVDDVFVHLVMGDVWFADPCTSPTPLLHE